MCPVGGRGFVADRCFDDSGDCGEGVVVFAEGDGCVVESHSDWMKDSVEETCCTRIFIFL